MKQFTATPQQIDQQLTSRSKTIAQNDQNKKKIKRLHNNSNKKVDIFLYLMKEDKYYYNTSKEDSEVRQTFFYLQKIYQSIKIQAQDLQVSEKNIKFIAKESVTIITWLKNYIYESKKDNKFFECSLGDVKHILANLNFKTIIKLKFNQNFSLININYQDILNQQENYLNQKMGSRLVLNVKRMREITFIQIQQQRNQTNKLSV